MEQAPHTARKIALTCVLLHNILRSQQTRQAGGAPTDDEQLPDCGLLDGGDGGDGHDRNPSRDAKDQRDYLRDYFNNEGAVPWQDGRL